MQILIVVLLCIIAVALVPWLFGILVAGAAAYGVIFVTAVVVAVFLIAAYAGHRFFIVHPREDRLAAEKKQYRDARLRAQDHELAERQAAQKLVAQEVIDARARAIAKGKAEEDAIQAEVDEQIREAKIRKSFNDRR